MEVHSVPGTFIHHLTATPGGEYYDPHLANEAPEAQRSSSTCLRSPREQVADPGGLSDLSVFCPVCTDTQFPDRAPSATPLSLCVILLAQEARIQGPQTLLRGKRGV